MYCGSIFKIRYLLWLKDKICNNSSLKYKKRQDLYYIIWFIDFVNKQHFFTLKQSAVCLYKKLDFVLNHKCQTSVCLRNDAFRRVCLWTWLFTLVHFWRILWSLRFPSLFLAVFKSLPVYLGQLLRIWRWIDLLCGCTLYLYKKKEDGLTFFL